MICHRALGTIALMRRHLCRLLLMAVMVSTACKRTDGPPSAGGTLAPWQPIDPSFKECERG